MTVYLGSDRLFSIAIVKTYFSFCKDVLITAADYYLYFHLIRFLNWQLCLILNFAEMIILFTNEYCLLAVVLSCFHEFSLDTFSPL